MESNQIKSNRVDGRCAMDYGFRYGRFLKKKKKREREKKKKDGI